MTRDLLIAELKRDEGEVLHVYDDATGQAIVPGYTLKGHPTVGVGRALDVNPLTETESLYLLNGNIDKVQLDLNAAYPWFLTLDDVRQRVIINMTFNMGLHGLAGFPLMLGAVAAKDYEAAADRMKSSIWYGQVGARAVRLVAMMRTGNA